MRGASHRHAATLGCAAWLLLGGSLGCGPDGKGPASDSPPPSARTARQSEKEPSAVARIGSRRITREELDEPLRLRLHDLERAGYEMRERRLLELVNEELRRSAGNRPVHPAHRALRKALEKGEVEIWLRPPEPPRVEMNAMGAPLRGPPDAPVTLLLFCDFQSPHCARVQPTLRHLLEVYPSQVRLAWRDFPLSFHRYAFRAAEASRCAGEQDAFWEYHDALYLQQDDLEPPSLERTAQTLGLDLERFRDCLNQGRPRPAIRADLEAAERLGLSSVPVLFVNGLYLKGPQPEGTFRAVIDGELRQLGLEPPPGEPPGAPKARRSMQLPRTQLPLILTGTVVADDPINSLAILRIEGEQEAQLFTPGALVLEGVTLDSVDPTGAYLRRQGRIEYLPLGSAPQALTEAAPEGGETRAPPRAGGLLRLRRDVVDSLLEPRGPLEEQLRPGRLDLEGKRLLKLDRVEPGSLYETLGLKARDVILQVDGEWIHDQENPLWDALRTRSRVTLLVMRGGFPKTFVYQIE